MYFLIHCHRGRLVFVCTPVLSLLLPLIYSVHRSVLLPIGYRPGLRRPSREGPVKSPEGPSDLS